MNKSKLTFDGGTGTVTGANFLLETGEVNILVDCGLIQGSQFADNLNRTPFAYNPADVDILIITHAHADHIGRIPKLVKDGFHGQIISTPATAELVILMLEDCVKVLADEARKAGILPLYEKDDVVHALKLWHSLPYHEKKDLGGGISLLFKDSGHILGAAMAEITREDRKITFTGDLGNSPSLLLCDTEPLEKTNYLIMESVYGDRNHEPKEERRRKLKEVIADTIKNKRTLVIPAFSLERTQVILYEMNEFFENGELQSVPVFVDSPLASRITEVYERNTDIMNDAIKKDIAGGDDVFHFPRLKFTVKAEQSHEIINVPAPKIIMAGSGMSNGGRILEHEKHYLSDKHAILLLVGYQAVGTLGRLLQDGAKSVTINKTEIPVRARIEMISGYSSHKDSDHLLDFVEQGSEGLEQVFVVMGELKSAMFLAQRINDNVSTKAICPTLGQSFDLEL